MHALNGRLRHFEYKIGDLARIYNLSFRTLRFYEEKELLRPRREGNQRVYSVTDRARLELILLAKRLGFSLATIWELIEMRKRGEAVDVENPTIDSLGLSRDEIVEHIGYLLRERDRIDQALEELRVAAARESAS